MIFLIVQETRITTISLHKASGISYKTAWRIRNQIENAVYDNDAYDKFAGLIPKDKLEAVKHAWQERDANAALKPFYKKDTQFVKKKLKIGTHSSIS